jgi:hypothetical protein
LFVNGVKMAGHRGSLAGSSNQVEFYPDLGYVLVILGNTDSGTEAIAAHVRGLLCRAPRRMWTTRTTLAVSSTLARTDRVNAALT